MEPSIENGAAMAWQMRSRNRDGVAGLVEVVEDDDELVAAEAGEDVVPSNLAGQPLGDAPEDCVSRLVSEPVVHLLEPVEIEEQGGEPHARLSHSLQRGFDAREQVGAVRQPGQPVVGRLVGELVRPGLEAGKRRRVPPGTCRQRGDQLERLEGARAC